jgi:hypothetical protein
MTITLDREGFTGAVKAVLPCVGGSKRPDAQQCLLVGVDAAHVDIVATNGHMLAHWREPIVAGEATDEQLLIANHKDLATWLRRVKGDFVAIDVDAGTIEARGSTFAFALCGGTYPPWRSIIRDVVERRAQAQDELVSTLRKHAAQFDSAELPEYAQAARDAAKALCNRSVALSSTYAATTERCFRAAKIDGIATWTGALDPIVSRSNDPEQTLTVITMPMRQDDAR